jgi:hypothetical protein
VTRAPDASEGAVTISPVARGNVRLWGDISADK